MRGARTAPACRGRRSCGAAPSGRTGARPARSKDTLEAVLAAPEREALLDWLRHRPMLLEVIRERRRQPGHDMISWLWSAGRDDAFAQMAQSFL